VDEPQKTESFPSSSGAGQGGSAAHPISSIWKNRYLIEKELARGGFGVVYIARDQQLLSKPVVIKALLEQSEESGYIQKKFRQEMEALARIDHPGIVGVLDVGDTPEGKPFLVMQFVEGVTLRSLITKGGMPLGQVSEIMQQIGHALTAAHEKGVLHRDLKPENIMLQTLGEGETQVKVIDFGIAAIKDSQVVQTQQTSMVAGTLSYMAPEQVLGRATGASDIYSLGVIAFEMVTGEKPENTPDGVIVKPSAMRRDLPVEAQNVILSALSYQPDHRQSRPRDFGDQLAAALGHARPKAMVHAGYESAPPKTSAAASSSRSGKLLLIAGSVVFVAVAVVGAALYSGHSTTPKAETPAAEPTPGVAQPSRPEPSPPPPDPVKPTPTVTAPAEPASKATAVETKANPQAKPSEAQVSESTTPQTETPAPEVPLRGDALQGGGQRARGPVQDLRQRLFRLSNRVGAVSRGIQRMETPNRRGVTVKRGLITQRDQIQQLMNKAMTAINAGDLPTAKENVELAEQQVEAVENFFRR